MKKKPEQDRGKKPSKTERKKIHRKKKTEKTQTKKPRKTKINITVSSIPPANQKKEEPKQQAVTFIITETKGKQKGPKGAVIHKREQNHRAASLLVISRSR
jgi:transposase